MLLAAVSSVPHLTSIFLFVSKHKKVKNPNLQNVKTHPQGIHTNVRHIGLETFWNEGNI